ncbi:putative aminopyrimidine aminohydrolase [Cucumis melo var. makuwa]|uniref:Aminopyrimidine aminohydrolase n=1 Tax=Cucumis melo var. makuwa TaxID=1194695 RepID=A0A5A7T9M1_CUCMM|nr:putative aminopyrimidine aminohydrolase [Cucumis melo var. makuwa]TYJ97070.1 putative aminopyrimidine aminohydrolase [Cucumis melo var. makuwa]
MRTLFIPKFPLSSLFVFPNSPFPFLIDAFRSLSFHSLHRSPSSAASSSPTMPPRLAMISHVDSDGPLARRLWNKCRRESILSMYTPFCVCLACGTLNIDTFRHYIDQDVHFLKAFARAYELAAECADDDDAKHSINELRKAVSVELKMHASFVKEWAAADGKESPVNPATIKYTDFLLATASGKIEGAEGLGNLATPFERTKLAAYALGAMTPCMRLYAYLATEFKGVLGALHGDHPYKTWIENYASKGFEEAAEKTEDVLEKLSATLTGEELDTIEKLYHQAMKLEQEFFCSQPVSQKTVLPLIKDHNPAEDRLVLFSDFDLTCTVVDSSAILAEIAIVRAPKPDQIQPEDQPFTRMSSADLRNTWGVISRQYTEEYEECIDKVMPPKTVEFKFEDLCTALEQLSDFEKRANNRVVESGVLKGLNFEDIRRAGEHLIIQDGCFNFFGTACKSENLNVGVHILSYCWCADLIRSSFNSGGLLTQVTIHANEFAFEEAVSTGDLVRRVESPLDKVNAFRKILENYGNDRNNLTVYIGDSIGDLLCLLEADIGIVIGSSASLRRLATQFGVSFVPLYPSVVRKQKDLTEDSRRSWKGLSGVLYTVNSWAEIHAFVLGC